MTGQGGIVARCAHGDVVGAVAFFRDGARLVSVSWDRLLRVFAAETGALLLERPGPTDQTFALAPDGSWLVTGSRDGVARIWDATTGAERGRIEGGQGLRALAVSPDGRLVALGSAEATIDMGDGWSGAEQGLAVWEASGPRRVFGCRGSGVDALAFSPDGRRLAALRHGSLELLDAANGEARERLATGVRSFAFAPDGARVAVGDDDGNVRVVDASSRVLAEWRAHADQVVGVAFAGDPPVVATGSWDGSVGVWDPGSGRRLASYTDHAGRVTCLDLSPDGRLLASGGDDGVVVVRSRQG